MKRILLYTMNIKRASQLVFLLGLAEINCTVVDEIEEACNWVSTAKHTQKKFDLILLESVKGTTLEKALLPQIAKITTAPIIYVGQQGDFFTNDLPQGINVCQSQNILESVNWHLGLRDSMNTKT